MLETCGQEWRHYASECLPYLSFVEILGLIHLSNLNWSTLIPPLSLSPTFMQMAQHCNVSLSIKSCSIKSQIGCAFGRASGCQETTTTNHGKRSESIGIEVPCMRIHHTKKTQIYSGRISPMQQFSIPKAQVQNQKFVCLTFIILVGTYTVGPWILMIYETNSMNKNVIPNGPQFIIRWYETVHQHVQALENIHKNPGDHSVLNKKNLKHFTIYTFPQQKFPLKNPLQ